MIVDFSTIGYNMHYKLKVLPKIFNSYLSSKLSALKIPGVFYPYLINLYLNQGITMADLTKTVFMDKANTSRMIKLMRIEGLVRIAADKEDKRIKRIYLTREGLYYAGIIEDIKAGFNAKIFDGITYQEKEFLNAVLDKIINNALKLQEEQC
ncbi:MAG: MarR family winged helix-turn-helix transcriptional regulator [Christensenellales bacterium]